MSDRRQAYLVGYVYEVCVGNNICNAPHHLLDSAYTAMHDTLSIGRWS